MYRDDNEAMAHRVDALSREAESLRAENQAMRAAVGGQAPAAARMDHLAMMGGAVYTVDVRSLPLQARARLAAHNLSRFPVWAIALLNVVTFGLFPMIHFGLVHGRLPPAAHNDPSAGKAIGFQFIPYFNLYWVFFSAMRLADRLNLQLRLRGLEPRAPKGLLIAACIFTVLPYINIAIGIPIIWTIAVCYLQSTVNQIAALPHDSWDATPPADAAPQMGQMGPAPAPMMPPAMAIEMAERAAKAQRLVTWSHVLGWGGLVVLAVGSAVAGVIGGGVAAGTVAIIGFAAAVTGAIIGQIGRGMQGRAI